MDIRKYVIVFVVIFVFMTPANADYIKSGELMLYCASAQDVLDGSVQENYGAGICIGLLKGMVFLNGLSHVSKNSSMAFCVPNHSVDLVLLRKVNQYIQKYAPADLDGHGVALLTLGLAKTFPCESR